MKYNLIFENIPEVILNTDMKEDTQQILKDFHRPFQLTNVILNHLKSLFNVP
jgi:hypothetical protein